MTFLILAAALVAASPAAAGSPTAHDADKPATPVKPKKICQKVEMTGSSVPKRVCRTVTEPAKPGRDAEQATAAQSSAENTN